MLLMNLDPPRLCNGTRLVITSMIPKVLLATIITGYHKEDIFIPKFLLIPTDISFEFEWFQFLVKLNFAIFN